MAAGSCNVRCGSRLCENAKAINRNRTIYSFKSVLGALIAGDFNFEIELKNIILVALRTSEFSHSLGHLQTSIRPDGTSAFPSIVLQNSFCFAEYKFSGPYARRSNNHLRGLHYPAMNSRATSVMAWRLHRSAIAACLVYFREIDPTAFWEFCNTIPSRTDISSQG